MFLLIHLAGYILPAAGEPCRRCTTAVPSPPAAEARPGSQGQSPGPNWRWKHLETWLIKDRREPNKWQDM